MDWLVNHPGVIISPNIGCGGMSLALAVSQSQCNCKQQGFNQVVQSTSAYDICLQIANYTYTKGGICSATGCQAGQRLYILSGQIQNPAFNCTLYNAFINTVQLYDTACQGTMYVLCYYVVCVCVVCVC